MAWDQKGEEAKGQLFCQQLFLGRNTKLFSSSPVVTVEPASLFTWKTEFYISLVVSNANSFNIHLLHSKSIPPSHTTRNFCPNFCNFQWKQIRLSLVGCFFSWGFLLLMGINHLPCDALWAPTPRGASGYWTPPLPSMFLRSSRHRPPSSHLPCRCL